MMATPTVGMSPLGQFLFILVGILRYHRYLFSFYIVQYFTKAFLQIGLTVALVTLVSWGISYFLVKYTVSNIEKHNRFDIFNDSDDDDDEEECNDDKKNDPDYQVEHDESSDDSESEYEIDPKEIADLEINKKLFIENIEKYYNDYNDYKDKFDSPSDDDTDDSDDTDYSDSDYSDDTDYSDDSDDSDEEYNNVFVDN